MPREGYKGVSFYLPDELIERIDVEAAADSRNRTSWITVTVERAIKKIDEAAELRAELMKAHETLRFIKVLGWPVDHPWITAEWFRPHLETRMAEVEMVEPPAPAADPYLRGADGSVISATGLD